MEDEQGVSPEELEAIAAGARRDVVRRNIEQTAGDTDGLLETNAKAVAQVRDDLYRIVLALAEANSLAGVRNAVAPLVAEARAYVDGVEARTIRGTYLTMGRAAVFAETNTRQTAVSDAVTPPE